MASFKRVLRLFFVVSLVLFNECASQEFCLTPNMEDAQCVPLESCPVIFNGVKSFNSTVIDFAKKSRCAVQGKRNGVCCGTLNYLKVISCVTPSKENGECVRVEECPAIFEGLQHLDDAAIELAKKSRCNINSGPQDGTDLFVCCGPPPIADRTGAVMHGPAKNPHAVKVSDRTYCGFQHTDDYFRTSENTSIDEFPWVALMVHSNDTGNEQQHCLGALINSRYVVTTAICVNKTDAEEGFSITSVQLGEYNTNSTTDCVSFYDDSECSDPVSKIAVERAILHPKYKLDKEGLSYNIALIRLAQSAHFSDYVRPICLPDGKFKAEIGTTLSTTGWGTTEWVEDLNNKTNIKKRAKGVIVPLQQCIENSEINLEGAVSEEFHICFREDTPNGPCADDSSAPLMSKSRNQWQLEGVLSFPIAQNCGVGSMKIYTNITRHLEWIMENAVP